MIDESINENIGSTQFAGVDSDFNCERETHMARTGLKR